MTTESIISAQKALCVEHAVSYVPCSSESMLGFALSTVGKVPINGLRHPAKNDTNGWYIWCGEQFSDAADFFAPRHASHVYEDYPGVSKFLGLPPGYRFLLAGKYVDVWFDESLLKL
jgi:hypothetical protein